jgi:hypothetical protein
MNGKFHGSRPVGRPRLKRGGITRDSLLPLNIRGWRRLAEDRNIWMQITE